MGSGRTVNPAGQARRRQAHGDHARGGEWPDVHSVDWLSVAGNPKGFAAALDLVRLLRSVELGWHARSHPSRTLCEVPRGGRQRSEPHRRSDRQPKREKRRKRGRRSSGRVTTPERVRLEGAYHLWRKVPSRQLSIDLEADERRSRVTGWAEPRDKGRLGRSSDPAGRNASEV